MSLFYALRFGTVTVETVELSPLGSQFHVDDPQRTVQSVKASVPCTHFPLNSVLVVSGICDNTASWIATKDNTSLSRGHRECFHPTTHVPTSYLLSALHQVYEYAECLMRKVILSGLLDVRLPRFFTRTRETVAPTPYFGLPNVVADTT